MGDKAFDPANPAAFIAAKRAQQLAAPGGFDPANPEAFIATRGAPPVEPQLDAGRGAPARVRLAVGSAVTMDDKLATARKFYPDAQIYKDDNIVYTDPATKRPTVLRPDFDPFRASHYVGNIAGAAPEIAEAVGGTLGGILAGAGATATAPVTGGMSYLAVPAGVAGGAVVGKELAQRLASTLGDTVDTRSTPHVVRNQIETAAVNAIGPRLGELLSQGGRAVLNTLPSRGRVLADVLTRSNSIGVDLPVGAATRSPAWQQAEKTVAVLPGGADVMDRAYNTANEQVSAAAQRMAQALGRPQPGATGAPQTAQGAGESMKQAATSAGRRFETRQGDLYDNAEVLIGANTPTPVRNTARLGADVVAELSRAPEARGGVLNPVLSRIEGILNDAQASGGIPFEALRQIRTDIGVVLESPLLMQGTGTTDQQLRRVYGALSDDISAAARQAGPDAERAMALADRYTRFHLGGANGRVPPAATLQKIIDSGSDEAAFKIAMAGAKDGGTKLAQIRRNFTPEEWDTVAASVWDRLGTAKPGAQGFIETGGDSAFSPQTFVTNWNSLSPESKAALFGGRRYADLRDEMNNIGIIAGRLAEAGSRRNTSNTAQPILWSGLGLGVVNRLMEGEVGQAAVALATGTVAPYAAARLMASPAFVRWLAGAPSVAYDQTAQHIAKLAAIGKVEPELRSSIDQYIDVLRDAQTAPPAKPAPAKK